MYPNFSFLIHYIYNMYTLPNQPTLHIIYNMYTNIVPQKITPYTLYIICISTLYHKNWYLLLPYIDTTFNIITQNIPVFCFQKTKHTSFLFPKNKTYQFLFP